MDKLLSRLYATADPTDEALRERRKMRLRLTREQSGIERRLMQSLTDEERDLFDEYLKLSKFLEPFIEEDGYRRGFREGMRMMADAVAPTEKR